MEITGKLVKLLPVQSGEGKNGTWRKMEFVIETDGKYPKQIVFAAFKDEKIEQVERRRIGETITVKFDLESREFNDKYYTNANAYSITGSSQGTTEQPAYVEPAEVGSSPLDDDSPAPADKPKRTKQDTEDASSDLPF